MSYGWERWHKTYKEKKEEGDGMKQKFAKIIYAAMAAAWDHWRGNYEADVELKEFMNRVGKKIANRDMFIGWSIWQEGYWAELERIIAEEEAEGPVTKSF